MCIMQWGCRKKREKRAAAALGGIVNVEICNQVEQRQGFVSRDHEWKLWMRDRQHHRTMGISITIIPRIHHYYHAYLSSSSPSIISSSSSLYFFAPISKASLPDRLE